MKKGMKLTGAVVATAVAGLFMAGNLHAEEAAQAPAKEVKTVKCSGVNACAGKGACKTATNACAGKNGCKGQAWVKMSEEECKEKGGTVYEG